MRKLYIFANEVESEFRDISVAIVMYYCAAFEEKLQLLALEIRLDFLAWSNRSDEIGVAYRYYGPSKKEFYRLVDKIDEELSDEGLAKIISDYWRNNFDEFIERTKEVEWSDYGCEAPSKEEFIRKLSRNNVAKILNSIITNIINE